MRDEAALARQHPQLVAQRLERFTGIVGKARAYAGSDCGIGTFAGFGVVDSDIAYAKLKTRRDGANIVIS